MTHNVTYAVRFGIYAPIRGWHLAWSQAGHMLGGCLHERPPNNPPRAPQAPEGLGLIYEKTFLMRPAERHPDDPRPQPKSLALPVLAAYGNFYKKTQ